MLRTRESENLGYNINIMKNIITLLVTLLSISISQGQTKVGITTEEEYNYMTKGFQVQISNGLDMKKGYKIGKTTNIEDEYYGFKFIPLYRLVSNDSLLVGHIVKATSYTWDNVYWYCLPISQRELTNKTFTEINKLDKSMSNSFFRAFAIYMLSK